MNPEILDHLDQLDHLEFQAHLDHQDLRVTMAEMVNQVPQVLPAQGDLLVQLVCQVYLDQKGTEASMVSLAKEAVKVRLVSQVNLDLPEQLAP